MVTKNFDTWNDRKKKLNNYQANFYHEREIRKNPYHMYVGKIEDKEAFVILSQIRLIDTKRLHDRLSILNKEKFEEIRKAVKNLI